MRLQLCCATSKRVLRTLENVSPDSREVRRFIEEYQAKGNYSFRLQQEWGDTSVYLGSREVESLLRKGG